MKIHVTWEVFVEDLLIDCMNIDSSQYACSMDIKLPKHLSRNQCKAMILGLGYIDFRNASDIKRIAEKILVPRNNPFKIIPKSVSRKIDEFYIIRNYIAHYSFYAKRSLSKMYKNNYGMRRLREPGDFLMSIDRKNNQTRFGNYIDAFHEAAFEMTKFFKI